MRGIIKIFSEYFTCVINFIFPGICIICGEEIEQKLVCNNCLNLVEYPKAPLCPCCGRPTGVKKVCSYCREDKILDYGRAFALYVPPVDKMIHHLKYRGKTNLVEFFGRGMANVLKNDFYLRNADFLTPVPLFWWKKMRRTYNQAELLARIIIKEVSIPLLDTLVRTRNTKTQTQLDHKKRKKNVQNAFRIRKGISVKDKKIILIDDVMTTGATIKECARILKEGGAKEVYSLVAAITP